MREWGFKKNASQQEMQFLATKLKRRLEEEGKETVFKRLRGSDSQEIPKSKILSFMKRTGSDGMKNGSADMRECYAPALTTGVRLLG